MSDMHAGLDRLRKDVLERNISRRGVLKRAAALGLSAPVIAGLLAACGDDDDVDTGDDAPDVTMTTGGAGGDTTPTVADDSETPAAGETEEPDEAGDATATSGETGGATGERGGGGNLRMLYWQAPTILNPHFSQGTKDDEASRICLEPLAEFDNDGNPVLFLGAEFPSLENGGVSEDGRTITWSLREGVTWHDGEDFNAEDVRFTWEFVSTESVAATTADTYMRIADVEIIDDYTIALHYDEPNPAWADAFVGTGGCILPEHIFREAMGDQARSAEANLSPIGTGPYRVAEFRPGDVVLYEINMEYWEDGKPFFDSIELKGGGDTVSATRAVLETDESDWAWNVQVEPDIIVSMLDSGAGVIVSAPGASAERIMVNFADPNQEVDGARSEPSTQHPIFQFKEARNALALAMPRDVIAEQLYGAGGEAEQGVVTSNNLNAPPRFVSPNTSWEYDLDAASELLSGVEGAEGYNLLYQTSINSVRQKTQEIVKQSLEQIGFVVELKSVDSAVFFSSDAGNPDTYPHFYADIEMYTNGPDSTYPITWAERFRSDDIAQQSNQWAGTNITRYNNPEFDELHNQAQTELDPDTQEELFIQMNDLSVNDFVEIPLVHRGAISAAGSDLRGYAPGGFVNDPWNIKDWTRES